MEDSGERVASCVAGEAARLRAPVSTASGSMLQARIEACGGVVDAWADPVLRSRPGADLLLCKVSEEAEPQSGDGCCRYVTC